MKIKFAGCILGFALALGGCATVEPSEPLPRRTPEAKSTVVALVPTGTPVAEAVTKMEAGGFECRVREKFGGGSADYLFCYANRPAALGLTRYWLVRFTIKEGRVYDVFAGVDVSKKAPEPTP